MQLRKLDFAQLEDEAKTAGVILPIEQTGLWARYQGGIEGRSPWGCFVIEGEKGEGPVAFVSFIDYETHGYHFLRSFHGPAWVKTPTPEEESEALRAIADYVRSHDRRILFVRLGVRADLPECQPVLSGVPYDRTVVVDVTGGDEEILSRMKPRGRRDVRKSLREAPITCSVETKEAAVDFSPYYEAMCKTGERDGFVPAPMSDYQDFLSSLGPDHSMLAVGRDESGEVVAWSMISVFGGRGVRYYAATAPGAGRRHAADKLVYFECCELGRMGCDDYDLMAIGSDFSPSLMGLNEFKTKFSKEVAEVAPDRDLPLRPLAYKALQLARRVRDDMRTAPGDDVARDEGGEKKGGRASRKEVPAETTVLRDDLLPVIMGGDVSCYAYAREFHEAYGVRSAMVCTGFIAAIEHSGIIDRVVVPSLEPEAIRDAIVSLAKENPGKRLPVIASTDALVEAVDQVRDELPDNVVLPIPAHDAFVRASDKQEFSRLCEAHGLRTPRTRVVSPASGDRPRLSADEFPCVAKAARSAEFSGLYAQGFKKVYCLADQRELDELLSSLADAGFGGEILLQELIEGDDTHMGAITLYADSQGKLRLFSAAQTLLEDHAPTMRGNSVSMIPRPMPDFIDKAAALLADLGYTGFAEIDMKRDAKTGEWVLLELNPRVGRNSYYVSAAGANPMAVMVDDLVDGRDSDLVVADGEVLYTLVPNALLYRYLADADLYQEVRELVSSGRVVDPQRYAADASPRRLLDVALTETNQLRKFRTYYPKPTSSSF